MIKKKRAFDKLPLNITSEKAKISQEIILAQQNKDYDKSVN